MRLSRLAPALAALVALPALPAALPTSPASAQTSAQTSRAAAAAPPRVLVWGGAYGFRHPSITTGERTLVQLAAQTGAFTATVTENPADLSMATLRNYDVLAWISTTGKPPLTAQQRKDVVRWSACGGGNLGIHAALDADYGWAEHAEIFGAQFDSHPKGAGSGAARMLVENRASAITAGWSQASSFMFDDEYYRWRTAKRVPGISLPRRTPGTDVLLSLDETTVGGDIQAGPLAYEHRQPIAWTKTFRGGGRVFYNNVGHSDSTWGVPAYQNSLVKGIEFLGGKRPAASCLTSTTALPPSTVKPSAPVAAQIGKACPIPAIKPRDEGFTWEVSGPARRLTSRDTQALAAGAAGGLSWGAQTWVVDLSRYRVGTAAVAIELTWPVPTDDYDLSVVTAWGHYGRNAAPGVVKERLDLQRIPHCAVLHVSGDNMAASSGQAPKLAIRLSPETTG